MTQMSSNSTFDILRENTAMKQLIQKVDKHLDELQKARDEGRQEVANAPLVRDLLRVIRERQAEADARAEEVDELDYLERLKSEPNTKDVGMLVAHVAAYASEEPHDLVSPVAKQAMSTRGTVDRTKPWSYYVSDKFEAHAREACSLIRSRHAQMQQAEDHDFVNQSDDEVRVRYARVVAALWRQSAMVSGKRYNTTKAIETLQSTIDMHLRRFHHVQFNGGRFTVEEHTRNVPLPRNRFL